MARERYLVNAGEETINRDSIVLTTKKDKRKNHWDYYKWYYICAFIGAVIIFFIIRSFVIKVNPDYQIALMTQEQYPEVFNEQLGDYIAQYGEDLNGDGKVKVQINNYQLYSGAAADGKDPSTVMAGTVKFTGDTMLGSSMIFMTDDASLGSINTMNDDSYDFFLDINTYEKIEQNETDREKVRIRFTSCKAFDDFVPTADGDASVSDEIKSFYFNDLCFSLRTLEGTKVENDEKAKEYFEASKILLERLKTGK